MSDENSRNNAALSGKYTLAIHILNNRSDANTFLAYDRMLIAFMQDKVSLLWIIFGTIGNLLSLLVLLRDKMRIHSTFTYLTLLALCDTLVLYFGLLRDYLINEYQISIRGVYYCKLHVFLFYFVLHMASWLLVAVNIDRLIAATFLSLSKKWCTPRTALKFSFYIAVVVFLLNAHFLYYVDSYSFAQNPLVLNRSSSEEKLIQYGEPINRYVYPECTLKPNTPVFHYFFQKIFTWIDASAQVILPFIIMVICNVNIIHKVLLTKNKTNGKNLKRLRKIKGMCVMIVSVSIIFLVLEAPVLILICLIQGNWLSESWIYMELIWTIVNLMMYTNHVINFFTYCMAGTKFRRELLRLLCVDKLLLCLSTSKIVRSFNFNIDTNISPNQTTLLNKNKLKIQHQKRRNLNEIEPEAQTTRFIVKKDRARSNLVRESSKFFCRIDTDVNANNHMISENASINLTSLILNKKSLLGESIVTINQRNNSIRVSRPNSIKLSRKKPSAHSFMSSSSSSSSDFSSAILNNNNDDNNDKEFVEKDWKKSSLLSKRSNQDERVYLNLNAHHTSRKDSDFFLNNDLDASNFTRITRLSRSFQAKENKIK